ncbi:hypothetical protein [Streptomyces sp. NPDC050264]|uniref:hypothetical protein n=1 Tax=Streptomyces sp. NPDC050264 TaxID=3155038 RepID=UPI0034222D82
MIILDLAALGPEIIGRAIITVAGIAGLGALLAVLAAWALTCAWPITGRRTRQCGSRP